MTGAECSLHKEKSEITPFPIPPKDPSSRHGLPKSSGGTHPSAFCWHPGHVVKLFALGATHRCTFARQW